MGLYKVPRLLFLGFGMGMMLTSLHMCGMVLEVSVYSRVNRRAQNIIKKCN